MNAGESHGEFMSGEVSLAAGLGALLPWITKDVSFEICASPRDAAAASGADVQEHDLALAALDLSERLLRQFFDDSPISVAVFDLDGRLLHFNRAFGAMLGFPAEDLRERRIEDLVHPADVPLVQERRRKLADGQCSAFQVETRFATANRRQVLTRMSGRLERAAGDRPAHIFAHIVELTEPEHGDENLRRQAEDVRLKNWDPDRYL